jgi:hypothetical protein
MRIIEEIWGRNLPGCTTSAKSETREKSGMGKEVLSSEFWVLSCELEAD